ncbi:MAG: hypothetical protein ACK2U9_25515, partial [Anaerolineae bacterium]
KDQVAASSLKEGPRRPIVLHQMLNEQIFWPAILIFAICLGLLIWNPPEFEGYRAHLILIAVGTGLILVLTFLYRLRAYVQCLDEGLRIQLPFLRLDIPYHEIKATRPDQIARIFPPEEQRWMQCRFLRWLWGHTAVVVEMQQLPRAKRWLKLWAGPYLIHPLEESFVLPTPDWIAFRAELDEFLARRRRRQV